MKNIYFLRRLTLVLACLFASIIGLKAQGLIISEFLANPPGTDSAKETVELLATENVNFAVTPYSVVFNNNGTATANGWVAGGALTYGFNITSGSVTAGQVVYVGGSQMAVSGAILRAINNNNTPGDGFGSASTTGVLGNGGGNADGVAVFNVPIGSVTASTVPVDAVFFGTGAGTAVVNGGADGYQLPVNDKYTGGKFQTSSFLAPDPASGSYITAAGNFDPVLKVWTTPRTFIANATYTATSSVTLLNTAAPASVSFATTHQTVAEHVGNATFNLTVANANAATSSVQVQAIFGTATGGADYIFSTTTINITANGTYPVVIPVSDDPLAEATEYVFFRLVNPSNANISGTNQYTLYIRDNDSPAPLASNALAINLLASYSNGPSATNSAEIAEYDPSTKYLYIANSIGAKLDIINLANPAAPVPVATIPMAPYGNINSVDVYNGLVACAIEDANPQANGKVVFFNSTGAFLNSVPVGALPDMVAFNHAGTKVYTVNEGEPNAAYTTDPEGSISVVDLGGGVANATAATIGFTQYNGQETALRAQGIRIFGPSATAAKDFEPEYITIAGDDASAWVVLQENNAVARLNLLNNTIIELQPLGYKDHLATANAMDVSDQTNAINFANWKIKGMYLPDGIEYFSQNGTGYYVTANEGDSRAYTGFNEETSVGAMNLDPTAFPDAAFIKNNLAAGRLKATNTLGDTDGDGDFDEIYAFGARSFSIRNAATGALVYDSGADLEKITAASPVFSPMFNASNGASSAAKNRSDDKGPEPEGVVIGSVNGTPYAFIGLERIGGVMAFDITDPAAPQFVTYANNRSVAANGPDRGAEGVIFIPAAQAPLGQPLLVLANEISSTLSIYTICTEGSALQTWYADADGDGYGKTNGATTLACSPPPGFSINNVDCNDNNPAVNPFATEICNGADDDCDNVVDDGVTTVYFADADADGFGNAAIAQTTCTQPNGYVANNTDCNDANPAIRPGAPELCNGADDDCDGFPESPVKIWTANGNGAAWEDAANWSGGNVPLTCQEVFVTSGANVSVEANGNAAVGKTLEVETGAQLLVPQGAVLDIKN